IATPGTGAVAREAPVAGVLEATLAGEFALQSGKLDQATYWYLQAARAARGDAALAERAAGIALLAGEDDAARHALRLWRAGGPAALALRAAERTLALRDGDADAARARLRSLLREPGPDGGRYAVAALGSGGRHPELSAGLLVEAI